MIFLLVALFTSCKEAEKQTVPETPKQSKNSPSFNTSIENSLLAYDKMREAFVQNDSLNLPGLASDLNQKLSVIDTAEGKGEVGRLSTVKRELTTIQGSHAMETKRHALNLLSDHLFQYLKSVQYDKRELFLQECPMAFNDTEPGLWISGADSIRNPFLGMHHPKYKSAMLTCGGNKDKFNYTGTESKEKEELK
jgi:hypothetical protein